MRIKMVWLIFTWLTFSFKNAFYYVLFWIRKSKKMFHSGDFFLCILPSLHTNMTYLSHTAIRFYSKSTSIVNEAEKICNEISVVTHPMKGLLLKLIYPLKLLYFHQFHIEDFFFSFAYYLFFHCHMKQNILMFSFINLSFCYFLF